MSAASNKYSQSSIYDQVRSVIDLESSVFKTT